MSDAPSPGSRFAIGLAMGACLGTCASLVHQLLLVPRQQRQRQLLQQHPMLAAGSAGGDLLRRLETLPEGISLCVCQSFEEAEQAAQRLLRRAKRDIKQNGNSIVGLDCEWTPPFVRTRKLRSALVATGMGEQEPIDEFDDEEDDDDEDDDDTSSSGSYEDDEDDAAAVVLVEGEGGVDSSLQHLDVELLQVCDSHEVVLFRFPHCLRDVDAQDGSDCRFKVPESLTELLRNPAVLKAGSAIPQDVKRLERVSRDLAVFGAVDLQPLSRHVNEAEHGTGLSALAARLLGIQLVKDEDIRCGDWGAPQLEHEQLLYAALDAWSSREVFIALFQRHGHNNMTASTFAQDATDRRTLDKGPRQQATGSKGGLSAEERLKRAELVTPARATPLYENCVMIDPEGTILCVCNEKKVQWYVERNLGTVVSTEPITLQLKFMPRGPGNAGDPYYMAEKQNCCVICGKSQEAINAPSGGGVVRHAVIPHSFRRHFPDFLKSRSSHDVCLLCLACSHRTSTPYESFRRRIRAKFGLKTDGNVHAEELHAEKADLKRMGRQAMALAKNKGKLPEDRRIAITKTLRHFIATNEHGGVVLARIRASLFSASHEAAASQTSSDSAASSSVDDDDAAPLPAEVLDMLCDLASDAGSELRTPQARWEHMVVEKISADARARAAETGADPEFAAADALLDFSREWREWFVQSMQPKFMPVGWRTDHVPRTYLRAKFIKTGQGVDPEGDFHAGAEESGDSDDPDNNDDGNADDNAN